MTIPILSTKIHIPLQRSKSVLRPRLTGRLNEGLHRRLTVVSAAAGFGKTTLVSGWAASCGRPVAWLSMDEGDNDAARFMTYLCAALQKAGANTNEGLIRVLQAPQPPPAESIITALANEISGAPGHFVLVLDDYHVITAEPVNNAIALLLERMPPQLHLVIATREDPRLPLAKLRVRDQLTEVRTQDLRFTASESAEFLDRVMGLSLTSANIALLESRTEGWIAGLQLAALTMQGHPDPANVLRSFTGSHRFVLDYLVEEVLQRQSADIQAFLLRTSILDRMCGPLCDAVHPREAGEQLITNASGQETLADLERANLFIVPLDHERRWYRYHHLFAELLRQRLRQSIASSAGNEERFISELHIHASRWYEDNGHLLEAFHHAAAADDVERAARLLDGDGMPLLFRGAVTPVMNWLDSLPRKELDVRPSLWVMFASALLMAGRMNGVEPKLQAAEKALQDAAQDEKTRDLIGHIASIRATMAVSRHQANAIMTESRRALEYLHPDNLPVRTATAWTLGYAYQLQGDRAAAVEAYTEALSGSQKIGHTMIAIMAALGLGNMQEAGNRLHEAAETYRGVLKLAGDPPLPAACEAHLGLARIFYEWNDLDAAWRHGQQSVQLARLLESLDRAVAGEAFLAKLMLARGEGSGAAAAIANAEQSARRQHFQNQMPHIAAVQAQVLLQQGDPAAAARFAEKHELHASLARSLLMQGNTSEALSVLEPLLGLTEAKEHADEMLKVMALLAAVLHAHGERARAAEMLRDALTMGEPGGFTRTFVDEGVPMYLLLREAAAHGMLHDYPGQLLAAFEAGGMTREFMKERHPAKSDNALIEPLSARELEVLRLIAQGLSNREIGERLFIALTTVKGHNRTIFDKLQVKRRTEAVARARKLGLL
ncbi:LuxR C-terminal-related transcriptional regulator [Paenibacillus spongiae]|uniref:LuxR C-terminal-related transcriptional regulator n=1 Tax=Paenibacillus spongiae TaxID=2909671 RepID=A0ABY5SNE8_9BACL|nr:LuxR C-terminal-related transcriptional regulator [Paenibacillus spongiae]UVI33733.1 LuxR C-terminal-related transcriptional regulator [Paenibacillus spongiae]